MKLDGGSMERLRWMSMEGGEPPPGWNPYEMVGLLGVPSTVRSVVNNCPEAECCRVRCRLRNESRRLAMWLAHRVDSSERASAATGRLPPGRRVPLHLKHVYLAPFQCCTMQFLFHPALNSSTSVNHHQINDWPKLPSHRPSSNSQMRFQVLTTHLDISQPP